MEFMEDGCRNCSLKLPPGFRFCPTDEEILVHFLYPKALHQHQHQQQLQEQTNCQYPTDIIPQLDLPLHPWELDGKALMSGNQYFFFSQKMENWVMENGYWKEVLDMEEPIFNSAANSAGIKVIIGKKKLFEFYFGQPPLGIQTNWLMQEYHLSHNLAPSNLKTKPNQIFLDCSKWVLRRVEERGDLRQSFMNYSDEDDGTELSCLDEVFWSLDHEDFDDITSSGF